MTEIKCHYCGGPTKIVAWLKEVPILAECLKFGEEDNHCKRTTIPINTECLECKKEFEWIYDPGWNDSPVCHPCFKKRMEEYFNDPETKAAIKSALSKKNPFLSMFPKDGGPGGKYIPVPLKYGDKK